MKLTTGTKEYKLQSDGVERRVTIHIPATLPPNPSLVIGLPGGGSNGQEWWNRHWDRHAESGFIIACPTSECSVHDSHWVTFGESATVASDLDERFISTVVDKLSNAFTVGQRYVQGFSSGAKMTHHLMAFRGLEFDGAGVCGHGITQHLQDAVGWGQKIPPIRIVFGTLDDNYTHPGPGLTDAAGTLEWYRGEMGATMPPFQQYTEAGASTTAMTKWYKGDLGTIEYAVIDGMPHRMAKERLGDPYYETDALLAFWRNYAGFR